MPFRRTRRSSRSSGRGTKRNKEWIAWTTSEEGLSFEEPRTVFLGPGERAEFFIITPGAAQDEWDEPTIVRILPRFTTFVAGTLTQISGAYRSTIRGGLITWKGSTRDDTLLGPALAAIDPGDGSLDWLWWDDVHFWHEAGQYIGSDTLSGFATPYLGRMDIRTKRKLETGTGLAGCFECLADSGLGVWLHFSGRLLLLNH